MTKGKWLIIALLTMIFFPCGASSQMRFTDHSGQLHFSNLDNWYFRTVKESFFIGGETIKLFQIGTNDMPDEKPESKLESPWGTSNLHARIGIDIANTCVFPEQRNDGFCCRMETRVRGVHVIGVALDALVTGAMFLGEFIEPVKSIKSPAKKMNHGIPFTKLPRGVKFDYKCSPGDNRIDTENNGKMVSGPDKAEFCMILQKRWEDNEGNVFATRIGGTRIFFGDTFNKWVNGATFPVKYGDISRESFFDPAIMGLIPSAGPMFVKNSKGIMVPLTEKNWGKEHEIPTHLVMYFDSSYQGIDFIGSPESKFWVDNITLIY